MSESECFCFEKKLAYHTAPSLLGIKCASLVSVDPSEFNLDEQTKRFNNKAKVKGLKIRLMCRCGNRILLFLYNEKLLVKSLSEKNNRKILKSYGYDDIFSIDNDLKRLSERISDTGDFPHEIGVFLGYPTEDVIGFIESGGKNCKFCGCWKVYGNVEQAKRTFVNYNKCRNFLCNKLNQGINIYQALKINS